MTADGRRAVSGAGDRTVRVWDLPELPEGGASPDDQTIYTNAKVLLTGDSGAGKTGLAQRLVHRTFEATDSTDGVWATQLKLEEDGPVPEGVEREIWLWDFAGQADYRLIHQLYMDGTDLALLVFDPQKDNPFEGLAQWDHDLTRAAGGGPSSSGSSPAGATGAGCGSARGRSGSFRSVAASRATTRPAPDGRRLRRTPQGDRRVDPLGPAAEDVVADDLQADQGGDPQAQGRRPRALADGRAEAGAGAADDRRAVLARDPADGRGAARQRGRGLAARLRRLRAAPARADQRLRRGAGPGGARPQRRDRLHRRGRRAPRQLPGAPRRSSSNATTRTWCCGRWSRRS